MQDPLLQTRVPASVLQRVQAAAEAQGDTLAGWLRRIVIKETRMNRIAGWLLHHRHADPTVHFTPGNHDAPTHFLEPLRDHSALERTFLLFGPDGHMPVSPEVWRQSYAFKRQSEYVFLLHGSANVWRIATAVAESTNDLMEVSLSAEPTIRTFRNYPEAFGRLQELGAAFSRSKGARGEGVATVELGSVHVSLDVAEADRDEMVLPRLVAMLERGLGLQ